MDETWKCPKCGFLDGIHVKFDETCEYCGSCVTASEAAPALEDQLEALRAKLEKAETNIATTTDLLNSWARESGVPELGQEYLALRNLADRLWGKWSHEATALRAKCERYKEALQYLLDSVDEHGDSTERVVYNVCTTALKEGKDGSI